MDESSKGILKKSRIIILDLSKEAFKPSLLFYYDLQILWNCWNSKKIPRDMYVHQSVHFCVECGTKNVNLCKTMYVIFSVLAISFLGKHMRFEFSNSTNFVSKMFWPKKKLVCNSFVISENHKFPSFHLYDTLYVVTRRACGF